MTDASRWPPLAPMRLRSARNRLDRARTAVEALLRKADRALGHRELLSEAWTLDVGALRLALREEDLLATDPASADLPPRPPVS